MFQIKSDKHETENKTIRFPVSLIEKIEQVIMANNNNVSFSGFVYKHVNTHWKTWNANRNRKCRDFLSLENPCIFLSLS